MMRHAMASVVCGAVLLAIAAPATSFAADSSLRPSGKALVRIDGGTAYAKELGKGKYRVIVPDGASITWLGEVGTSGTRSGTFTAKALVAGWTRLGQRQGAKALTTLTWGSGEASRSTLAYLARPRINGDGLMTFVARPVGMPLPRQMEEFSINIARAGTGSGPAQRSNWSTTFSAWPINDNTAYVSATVANNNSATVSWTQASPYTPASCRDTISLPGSNGYTVTFGSFPCGDLWVNGKTTPGGPINSNVKLVPSSSATNNVGAVIATFSVTPSNPADIIFTFSNNIAQWSGTGGNSPTPVPTS